MTDKMTFEQWYDSLEQLDKPQFKDVLSSGHSGEKYRVVYSTDPELWQLADYVVMSQQSCLVHLTTR